MQIPILSGVFTDAGPDFRTSYPVNMVPVPKGQGISQGYLRPADGISIFGTGPGIDRGGINWEGSCYRVMGEKLVRVFSDGTITTLGDVGNGDRVRFDYSFDRLAVRSAGRLYYWDGSALTQVTDVDLGNVVDFLWVDGYFMTTDGEFLVVTELNDPLSVNPLKYGSSEIDPDPVKALLKLRNEVYALNRNTIEVFDNIGGEFFPFQRIEGAQIQKGVIGTNACCVYLDAIAFMGSARNETPGIYIGSNANALKISTQEIDTILLGYTEDELSTAVLESRNDKANQYLIVHLHDRSFAYDAVASGAVGSPVWFHLTSGLVDFSQYRGQNHVWCYDQWIVGDPQSSNLGTLSDTISSHFDNDVRWEFGTTIVYNEGRGAIVHELELVCLTGRAALGEDPQISTSYTTDGVIWSQDKFIRAGKIGERNKRITWFNQGALRHWRAQRFRGDSQSHISVARLEARIEALNY